MELLGTGKIDHTTQNSSESPETRSTDDIVGTIVDLFCVDKWGWGAGELFLTPLFPRNETCGISPKHDNIELL